MPAARTPPVSHEVEGPYAWIVAAASMLVMTVGMGGTYLAVVALKPIAAEFDWPRAVPSFCYALTMIGAGLGGLVMGRWADQAGMGPPALVGALAIPLGAWLASTSQGATMLYVAHGVFLGFFGNGAFIAPLLANTTRWFERRRGMAVAVVASGQSLAGAIWPPVLRYLTDSLGWRQAFSVYALIAAMALLPLCLVLRPRPPGFAAIRASAAPRWDGRALGWPGEIVLALLCVAIVGCCVAMAMPMVHLIAHATDLGHAGARAAEMLALMLACAALSRLLFGVLADRIGGLRALFLGSLGQALMLVAFAYVQSFAGLYAVAAIFGLVYGGIVPCYALIVREVFPERQLGWRLGAVILFGALGMALGGWLGGLIFDLTGSYRYAFLVGVAFNLLNLAAIGVLIRRDAGWRLLPA